MAKPRTRLDVSQLLCVGEDYFFFFLPVFFAFFAFLAFLAMLPSTVLKLVQCRSTSTCISTEYTTIAELILCASKKVNGGQNPRVDHLAQGRLVYQRSDQTLPRLRSHRNNIHHYGRCSTPLSDLGRRYLSKITPRGLLTLFGFLRPGP